MSSGETLKLKQEKKKDTKKKLCLIMLRQQTAEKYKETKLKIRRNVIRAGAVK